ncbi:MAG: hypothetical protein V4644_03445 [Patescibacteria group bacterium]
MKNLQLWIAGFILLVLTVVICIGAYVFLQQGAPEVQDVEQYGGLFPTSGGSSEDPSGDSGRSISLASGASLVVRDFLNNGSTFRDPLNEGSYYVAGKLEYCLDDGTCPDTGTPEFSILYLEPDQTFLVSLASEPLGESRMKAEAYLKDALGISNEEMCALRYTVGTTVSVNEAYGSITNLGFSFCPDAVRLP